MKLLGQDQFPLTGALQAINLAVVMDFDDLVAAQQLLAGPGLA
jgi:hypothetical protein